MKVLIVDDSSFKRKVLAYVIERHGHEVLEAGDGEEGLQKARANMPDIIISDLLMPRMDGFQFLKNIKKDEQLRAIPFVVYSVTYKVEKVKELVLSLGASGILEGLDQPDRLWQEVQEIINRGKETQANRPIIEEDEEFLRDYSRIVASKLEEKVTELEKNITELKRAEEAIKAMAKFPAENPNPVLRVAADGTLLYANRSSFPLLELWGCRAGQLLPGPVHALALDTLRSGLGRELKVTCGEAIYSLLLTPIAGAEYINIYGRDITEGELAKESLRRDEEKLQAIIHSIPGPVVISRKSDGQILYVNSYLVQMFGLDEKGLIGNRTPNFYYDPGDRKVLLEELSKVGYLNNHEAHVMKADGTPFWVMVSIRPVRYDKEECLLSMFVDIDERKRAEDDLWKSREYYRLLLDTIPHGIEELDISGTILFSNKEHHRMRGYDDGKIVGMKIWDFLDSEEERQRLKDYLQFLVVEQPKPTSYFSELRNKKEGRLINGQVDWDYKRDRDGNLIGFLAIITDITDRLHAEKVLKDYNKNLEEQVGERTAELLDAKLLAETANRVKSEFLANMSHELRTPLNAVIGFSEMMYEGIGGPLTEKQKEYLGDIVDGGKHLLSLISDILDLSKIEAGATELESKEFSLREMLEGSVRMFIQKASKHNITTTIDVSDNIGTITADERKIKQVIVNLLSNAYKFTPDGGSVLLSAQKVNSEQLMVNSKNYSLTTGGDFTEISVADTGIGISEEDRQRLFTPFEQLDNVYTKRYKGTGLGLYLSKKLVELHGGRLWLDESEQGKGSRFAFIIPVLHPATTN